MKIIVCIKQTFDTEARIRLADDKHIDDSSVLYIVNPYDEYAVEEALRIKEKEGGEVSVVSMGSASAKKALQHCLAMGADHAMLIENSELDDADSHTYAVVLSKAIQKMEYDLILCGRESVDAGTSQVPTRLAELLDLPQVNAVSKLRLLNGKAKAKRDIEGGYEIVEFELPGVISVQKGINEVRYPSMRHMMKASKKPIERISLDDLGITVDQAAPFCVVEKYMIPESREGGRRISGDVNEVVEELTRYLKDEVKAI